MAGNTKPRVTVDVTTGIGTLSFPHLFTSTASKNDKGETTYDLQLIIPKTQKEDLRALMVAIKKVGEAQWGDKWKQVRHPLRDGDKEADDLTEDGSTKGEKYPERLGCFFLNARSNRPVGVYDRTRTPITNPEDVYGGCKAKVNVTFYPYSSNGNHGIGVGLNGVQKVADGESFGGGRPSVEAMFDELDDEDINLDADDFDLEDEEPEETPKARRAPAKKAAAAPAKKAAARPAAKKVAAKKVVEAEVEDDEDDLYDDLDDLDDLD